MKPTRREFLRSGLCGAAAALTGARVLAEGGGVKTNLPMAVGGASGAATTQPATTAAAAVARVVQTRSPYLCGAHGIETSILHDFIEEGLCAVTGASNGTDAWNKLLKPSDVILIKCNQSAREQLGTTPPVIDEMLRSMVTAGFSLDQIMVLEAGDLSLLRKTRKPDLRWQGKIVEFGNAGKDSFLAALDEATAIINVPFIKTHSFATMSGCLKNLSHGLIRHPARFHANGCDPAIGQIVASEPIRSKLRLNVVNGVRLVFDKGPDAQRSTIHDSGTMLFSTDPVAADAVAFGLLNSVRSERGLKPLFSDARIPKQLLTAHQLGLGQCDGAQIQSLVLDL